MSEQYINIGASDTLSVSLSAVSRVLSSLSGDAALLLLYIMKNRGGLDRESAMAELSFTEERFNAALSVIMDNSSPAVSIGNAEAVLDEPPAYTAKELAQAMDDKGFSFVRNMTVQVLGRDLHKFETNTLYTLHDYYKFPPEVMAILLNHLKNEQERNSTADHPVFITFANIKAMAIDWQKRGIYTADAADAYVKELELTNEGIRKCIKILGLGGHKLSASEKRAITQCIELDPSFKLIELAYDATVFNTGSLKWSYMIKILQSWHEKGYKTPDDVNGEKRRTRLTGNTSEYASASDNRDEYEEQVLKFIESDTNGDSNDL